MRAPPAWMRRRGPPPVGPTLEQWTREWLEATGGVGRSAELAEHVIARYRAATGSTVSTSTALKWLHNHDLSNSIGWNRLLGAGGTH